MRFTSNKVCKTQCALDISIKTIIRLLNMAAENGMIQAFEDEITGADPDDGIETDRKLTDLVGYPIPENAECELDTIEIRYTPQTSEASGHTIEQEHELREKAVKRAKKKN